MDVVFQNADVCIIDPRSTRKDTILIFTVHPDVGGAPIKSGMQLHKEGVAFGRTIYHPYIFFRAPYCDDGSYNHRFGFTAKSGMTGTIRTWIRVDPNHTCVYSSETRAKGGHTSRSRIPMNEYFKIIHANQIKIRENPAGPFYWDMYTYQIQRYSNANTIPYDIARQSEVLVHIPELPVEWTVTNDQAFTKHEARYKSTRPDIVKTYESSDSLLKFKQKDSIVNFGSSSIKTFGLINCIAIGGVFVDAENQPKGAFMTHESPRDIDAAFRKIECIQQIIAKKNFRVSKTILFKMEKSGQSTSSYLFSGVRRTYPDLCNEIAKYCQSAYNLPLPQQVEYGYYAEHYFAKDLLPEKLALCGKAIINPQNDFTETFNGRIEWKISEAHGFPDTMRW